MVFAFATTTLGDDASDSTVGVFAFAITTLGDEAADSTERPGRGPTGSLGKFGNSTELGG
jgi:hypothetical protein